MKTAYAEIAPFTTKDGSTIRELLHPAQHGPGRMSFAEAVVEPGATTMLHLHRTSEEIYHVTQGAGTMRMGDEEFSIRAGDTVLIPAGTRHNVTAGAGGLLRILCACNPPYSDEDTALI